MFHAPGEYHMSDPVFVRHKRWQSVPFQEQQKKSSSFQREDLTRSYPAIFAKPDSNRINRSCMCTMAKEENSDEKSLIERPDRHTWHVGVFSLTCAVIIKFLFVLAMLFRIDFDFLEPSCPIT